VTLDQPAPPPTAAIAPQPFRMVVGGRPADAADGSTFDVLDPASSTVIARVPRGGTEDVDRAVEAARQAFDGEWSTWSATRRGRAIEAYAQVVRAHLEELAQLESANGGKPIGGARWEIDAVARVLEYYGGAANKLMGETIPVSRSGFDFTLREPVGVVGLIVPWNFPAMLASWKLGPALAAGNTVVLKPASYTPLTAIRLAELALEAGLPAGVLNVVTGPGASVGAAIAAHHGVDKVAFTGETATGQEIMRAAAGNTKKISLELGGKSPNIVFADADLERATSESPYAVFDNCGQDCCARSRIFVERSVHDAFVEQFAAATRRVKVGDPRDPATEVGSLISLGQRDRVEAYIRSGLEEGARLVVGGTRPAGAPFDGGAFLLPAVFDGVTGGMRIAREEIFGPVVSIIPFDTEDEVVRMANASQFGLSGSIWTRDIARAIRVAKGVRAGVLSVNCNNSVHVEAPFGGYRMSGIGRELGMHALDEYTEIKNVFVDLG
jgi:acyl-CoA reductase-like NAD-dependent aldehyde dehydrogenase